MTETTWIMGIPVLIGIGAWVVAKVMGKPKCPFCTRTRMCASCMTHLDFPKEGADYKQAKYNDKPNVVEAEPELPEWVEELRRQRA